MRLSPLVNVERSSIPDCITNAMPLIRYKIEDVGVASDEVCPCGRGLPLMKLIEGR